MALMLRRVLPLKRSPADVKVKGHRFPPVALRSVINDTESYSNRPYYDMKRGKLIRSVLSPIRSRIISTTALTSTRDPMEWTPTACAEAAPPPTTSASAPLAIASACGRPPSPIGRTGRPPRPAPRSELLDMIEAEAGARERQRESPWLRSLNPTTRTPLSDEDRGSGLYRPGISYEEAGMRFDSDPITSSSCQGVPGGSGLTNPRTRSPRSLRSASPGPGRSGRQTTGCSCGARHDCSA